MVRVVTWFPSDSEPTVMYSRENNLLTNEQVAMGRDTGYFTGWNNAGKAYESDGSIVLYGLDWLVSGTASGASMGGPLYTGPRILNTLTPCIVGETYTCSASVDVADPTIDAELRMYGFNSTGNCIGVLASSIMPAGTTGRLTVTKVIPATLSGDVVYYIALGMISLGPPST